MLPGLHTCSPFEEGILQSWIGGLVPHRLGRGCVQKSARGGQPARLPLTAGENEILPGESGTVVPLLTCAASAPWLPPMPAPARSAQSLSGHHRVWSLLTTSNVGNIKQGQGFQITKCYPLVVRSMSRHFATCLRNSQWEFLLLRPCCGAQAVRCRGVCLLEQGGVGVSC